MVKGGVRKRASQRERSHGPSGIRRAPFMADIFETLTNVMEAVHRNFRSGHSQARKKTLVVVKVTVVDIVVVVAVVVIGTVIIVSAASAPLMLKSLSSALALHSQSSLSLRLSSLM